jgi:hypothetical protein
MTDFAAVPIGFSEGDGGDAEDFVSLSGILPDLVVDEGGMEVFIQAKVADCQNVHPMTSR